MCVLDERFSPDASINNFLQLQQTEFYARCVAAGVKTISTIVGVDDSLQSCAGEMDASLRAWKQENPTGVVIATMGIGPDGHTAGIFPGSYDVDFEGDRWVVGYCVPKTVNEHTERYTVTYTFLKEVVDEAIVYAIGESKEKIVEGLELNSCNVKTTPACSMLQMKSVTLYTTSQ